MAEKEQITIPMKVVELLAEKDKRISDLQSQVEELTKERDGLLKVVNAYKKTLLEIRKKENVTSNKQ